MKLYEISADYRAVLERFLDAQDASETMTSDGEILTNEEAKSEAEQLSEALDAIGDAFDRKVEAITIMARELEAEADAIRSEEKRLAKRAAALENRAKGLEEYVKTCFIVAGKDSLKTTLFSFTLGKPATVVQVLDVAALPEDLVRVIPESREPDKNAIKKALQGGRDVPGAQLSAGKRPFTVR